MACEDCEVFALGFLRGGWVLFGVGFCHFAGVGFQWNVLGEADSGDTSFIIWLMTIVLIRRRNSLPIP